MRQGCSSRRRTWAMALMTAFGCGILGVNAAPATSPALPPATALPRQAVMAWSTYLRAGPGETYAAITELEHDTRVSVVGCDGRWCRISDASGSGYVDRDALDLPRTLAPQPPATMDCVVVGQADNRGPIPTRFCSARGGS